MKLPSALILLSATIQIVLGGALGLGFGPIPQFGMRGVACGTLIAFATGSTISCWYLFSGRGRLNLATAPFRFRREMFFDILKVGAVACFSPLQSVLAITIFTHMLARFGTEVLAGYGIGARLEFMPEHRSRSRSASHRCRWSAWRSAPDASGAPAASPGPAD